MAQVEIRGGSRRLALSSGGGSGSSSRGSSLPDLATAALSGGVSFLEDWYGPDLASAGKWTFTNITGTGTAGGFGTATSVYPGLGILELVTGTSANDIVAVDLTGRGTGGATTFPLLSTRKAIGVWRYTYPSTNLTSTCHGFGWVNSTFTTVGVNWVTDPDTAFAGGGTAITGLVFTRHAASITGDGGDTGALVMRFYDAATTRTTSAVAVASASIVANVAIKIEVYFDGPAGLLYVYQSLTDVTTSVPANPTQITGSPFTVTGVTNRNLRPSIQHQTTTAAARTIYHDLYYQEIAQYNASGVLLRR